MAHVVGARQNKMIIHAENKGARHRGRQESASATAVSLPQHKRRNKWQSNDHNAYE